MITYNDIKHRDYNTLTTDYDDEYADNTGPYFGDPAPVQDASLLQSVTLSTLGFSVKRVKDELTGLGDILDPRTNKPYPNSLYKEAIYEAANWAEQYFDIVIRPRVKHERDDYNKTDYMNYGMIRTDERPLIQVDDLRMIWNNNTVMKIPREWLKLNNRFGLFKLNPTALFAQTSGGFLQSPTLCFPNGAPNTGMPFGNSNFVPGLFGTTYIAGMLPRDTRDAGITRDYYAPYDLIAVVSKIAAIFILEKWGRSVLTPGIAGYGVHIDGIGSNITSTQSAENTGSSGDIKILKDDLKPLISALKSYWGYNFGIIS